jgi:hypothetical protein
MGAMNEFRILDPNGHSTEAFSPDDTQAVEEAGRLYERLRRQGYRAFGAAGRAQERFDPSERETILVPPIHGG